MQQVVTMNNGLKAFSTLSPKKEKNNIENKHWTAFEHPLSLIFHSNNIWAFFG